VYSGIDMNKITLIGEKIISSNRSVKEMMLRRDSKKLFKMAEEQISAGASVIDINSAMLMKDELDAMIWAAGSVIEQFDIKVSIDSPDIDILEKSLKEFGNRVIVNSLSADGEELSRMLPLISECQAGVIIILKDRSGIPVSSKGRLELAYKTVNLLEKAHVSPDNVYFDPIVTTIGAEMNGGKVVLEAFSDLKQYLPEYKRVGGLSNISFGLPLRKLLNKTFLSMAIANGMTTVICNPTDRGLIETLRAAETIVGADPGCRDFLKYYRKTKN
jgi:5-methyltetrahydrofolate--homocysteine methyltransferase